MEIQEEKKKGKNLGNFHTGQPAPEIDPYDLGEAVWQILVQRFTSDKDTSDPEYIRKYLRNRRRTALMGVFDQTVALGVAKRQFEASELTGDTAKDARILKDRADHITSLELTIKSFQHELESIVELMKSKEYTQFIDNMYGDSNLATDLATKSDLQGVQEEA